MRDLLWIIPLLPFLGALLNATVLWNRASKKLVAAVACGVVGLAAVLGLVAIGLYMGSPEQAAGKGIENDVYLWVPAGDLATAADGVKSLSISMGFLLDPLSSVMLFVVTFVGFWIHVYSVGYMHHEDGFQRYFIYLNLFMGAMLLLVMGNNFLVMFVGWEGVGLCSYLLIGYYYKEDFPPFAGRKAFITNRVGDFGFLLGLFALVATFGTLKYTEIFPRIAEKPELLTGPSYLGLTLAGFIALFLFIGAMGKSAQIPLYVWLPDAMAGPTPVSALIHAATMVTAGVYMVARANVIYQLAPGISLFVAIVGCATAIFAATIGLAQNDIKKVLAYSTVSQLGFMFLAAGLGAYIAAIFHLMTHAFFKALLFLGSGSVIHAMGGEQDMRSMGGLKKHLPATHRTFWIGVLAISGVPLLSGFFSKDEILHEAAGGGHWVLWAVALFTAGLTACYMGRAFYLTFHGQFRGTHEQEHHLHESPRSMTIPLWVLAVGAVVAGYVGLPKLLGENVNLLHGFLKPVIGTIHGHGAEAHHVSVGLEVGLMLAATAVGLLGLFVVARKLYRNRGVAADEAFAAKLPAVQKVLANKYYVDEAYDATVIRGTWGLGRALFRFDAGFIDGFLVNGTRNLTVNLFSQLSGLFDKFVVDGLVNFVGWISSLLSRAFRRVQTGYVGSYALVMAAGMFALVCVYLFLR